MALPVFGITFLWNYLSLALPFFVFVFVTKPKSLPQGKGSTFYGLSAQSDDGVDIRVDITTVGVSGGYITIDGDADNQSVLDTFNSIDFTDGRTLKSNSMLTLEATTGKITLLGTLSLLAKSGIEIHNSMEQQLSQKRLIINADSDGSGDGTFTTSGGTMIYSKNSDVTVTAWDIDLEGIL